MSQFAVTLEKIGEIRPIPKADRIEVATLAGMDFQFVVGKGQFQVGQASDGASLLTPGKRREGIVIKPLTEGRDDGIGRLVLKQRSPAYLANSDL